MALIQCTECKRDISDKAAACPGCGEPGKPREKSDRAVFSSLLAVIAAAAIAAFTFGINGTENSLRWGTGLVVAWSYALAVALLVWALRDWLKIHWIGNPTLAMVAGASGTAIAAVALAFQLASSKEQDMKARAQLAAQLQALERIEKSLNSLKELSGKQAERPVSLGSATATTTPTPGK